MFGNNPFLNKDPLVEAVRQAQVDGDIRRAAEALVNEEFGVYSRKAVVREQLAAYDAALEEAYTALKEGNKENKEKKKEHEEKTGMEHIKKMGGFPGQSLKRTARELTKEGLDPVGQEDDDIDNDGKKNTKSDKYLKHRRDVRSAAIKEGSAYAGKNPFAPNDPSVQGSGDVTSSPEPKHVRPSNPERIKNLKDPRDPSVQGSGDVTMKEDRLDELTGKGKAYSIGLYHQNKAVENARNKDKVGHHQKQAHRAHALAQGNVYDAYKIKATPARKYSQVDEETELHESLRALVEERKRTAAVSDAFLAGQKAKQKTLQSHGTHVTYHGNTIAKHVGDEVHVTAAGYGTSPSTRGHMNGILSRLGSEKVHQKKGKLMHGDKEIGSDDWIKVKKPEKATFNESSKAMKKSFLDSVAKVEKQSRAAGGLYWDNHHPPKQVAKAKEEHGRRMDLAKKVFKRYQDQVDEGVTISSAGYGKVKVKRGGKTEKTFKDPRDAKMFLVKKKTVKEDSSFNAAQGTGKSVNEVAMAPPPSFDPPAISGQRMAGILKRGGTATGKFVNQQRASASSQRPASRAIVPSGNRLPTASSSNLPAPQAGSGVTKTTQTASKGSGFSYSRGASTPGVNAPNAFTDRIRGGDAFKAAATAAAGGGGVRAGLGAMARTLAGPEGAAAALAAGPLSKAMQKSHQQGHSATPGVSQHKSTPGVNAADSFARMRQMKAPTAAPAAPVTAPKETPNTNKSGYFKGGSVSNYTVKRGETLSGIAKSTHQSVSDLVKMNKIGDPNKIATGAKLMTSVPKPPERPTNISSAPIANAPKTEPTVKQQEPAAQSPGPTTTKVSAPLPSMAQPGGGASNNTDAGWDKYTAQKSIDKPQHAPPYSQFARPSRIDVSKTPMPVNESVVSVGDNKYRIV